MGEKADSGDSVLASDADLELIDADFADSPRGDATGCAIIAALVGWLAIAAALLGSIMWMGQR